MGKIKGWVWVLSIILLAGGRYFMMTINKLPGFERVQFAKNDT